MCLAPKRIPEQWIVSASGCNCSYYTMDLHITWVNDTMQIWRNETFSSLLANTNVMNDLIFFCLQLEMWQGVKCSAEIMRNQQHYVLKEIKRK